MKLIEVSKANHLYNERHSINNAIRDFNRDIRKFQNLIDDYKQQIENRKKKRDKVDEELRNMGVEV